MSPSSEISGETQALVQLFHSFCFPNGVECARRIEAVETVQHGEMRSSPEARWMPFTATEYVDTRRSEFRWEARIGSSRLSPVTVVDAMEAGRGSLIVSLGGLVPVKKNEGKEIDIGEFLRYLGAVIWLPPVLLNHPTLACEALAPLTLRLSDRSGPPGVHLDLELGPDGSPLLCRADRPRAEGNETVLTPWSGAAAGFTLWEGFRVAKRMEATWHMPGGAFTYYRSEVTSLEAVPSRNAS
jgi:hypothetical protein